MAQPIQTQVTQAVCRLDNPLQPCAKDQLATYAAQLPDIEPAARGSVNFEWRGKKYNLFCRNNLCTLSQIHEPALAWQIVGGVLTIASLGIFGSLACAENPQENADVVAEFKEGDVTASADSNTELPFLFEYSPQCTSESWLKQAGSHRHHSVASAKNGGFLTTSDFLNSTGSSQEKSPIIELFNSNGESQWKTSAYKDLTKTTLSTALYVAKSGYLLGGRESTIPISSTKTYTYGLVMKVDESGKNLWRTAIPHDHNFIMNSEVTSIALLSAGIFSSNTIYDQSDFPYTNIVILDDLTGLITGQISKTLPSMLIEDMERASTDRIIAVGFTYDAFSKDPSFDGLGRIVEFDTYGNIIWSITTNTETSKRYSRVLRVEPFISGGYMIFGAEENDVTKKTNLFTAKINENDGSFIWRKTITTAPLLAGNYDSTLMYNGAIAVVGVINTTPYVDQFDNNKLWIALLNGESSTSKEYTAPQMQVGGIIPASDGLIIVGGRFSQNDGVVIRTDSDGNICKSGN